VLPEPSDVASRPDSDLKVFAPSPGPLEIFARHKEHDAVVVRVPDADLLGSGAPVPCDHDDFGIFAHDRQRVD
jgi:hypothetical protein